MKQGSKTEWLAARLRCLRCGGHGFDAGADRWTCRSCGAPAQVLNRAVSFIDEALAAMTKVNATNRVSAHAYSPSSLALIATAGRIGGMALDCGSGSRDFVSDHLVQVEITPYDNVDVLAVNQKLPFQDASFDVVLSYDVLEHVSDPFASARELARVLRPGGVLHINVPFLQTEHGYPHHYYNMTRQGLQNLFDGLLACEAHVVPRSGSAQAAAWYILTALRGGMDKETRTAYESLTVGEILALPPKVFATQFPVSEAADWQACSATQAFFRKPGGEPVPVQAGDLPVFKPR